MKKTLSEKISFVGKNDGFVRFNDGIESIKETIKDFDKELIQKIAREFYEDCGEISMLIEELELKHFGKELVE